MAIVSLVEICSAVILDELSNGRSSDIGIGTKPEEGQMILSVLEPFVDLEIG